MTPERWREVKEVLDVAVALGGDMRERFLVERCGLDVSLLHEVESLLQSHEVAGSAFLETPAGDLGSRVALPAEPNPSLVGRRIGAYDIVAELGRGGMGEVYRARRADGQFTKEVALKLVRTGYDSTFITDRFRTERQILAGLEHPNIARLLDGGATDDGTPFLVMELVEGAPIDEYCEAHRLRLTDRLGLFRDVCAAVQYAHQRLVVHRDLKPGNILVASDGTPKLVDFGIAKILDAPGAVDVTHARPMTPEYASPEQIAGEPITTASDVYSLGVVLYGLLTGEPPSRTPTRSHRRLEGDLDTIVRMALRDEPARRYGSVEQLSEDLRRYLENRPVSARKDSWSYRSRKFILRHRVGVASAAVAIVALIAGTAAIARSASIARRQAAIAQARFTDVKELSNSLIFEFNDAIQNLPGATKARQLLLDRAVTYLDRLAKDASGDPDLQRELAWGYQKLSVVQGSPTEANLGDLSAAEASIRKATVLFEAVAKARPDDVTDQLNAALGHRVISFYGIDDGRGRGDLDRAVAITERLITIDPSNMRVKAERSVEYQNQALMQEAAGDRVHALESFQQNLALKRELIAAKYPGSPRMVAMATALVGDAFIRLGRIKEALATDQESVRAYEAVATELASKRELAVAREKLGDVQMMAGDAAGALASYRLSRTTVEAMAHADPENRLLQLDLAGVEHEIGRALAAVGKYDDASAALTESIRRYQSTHANAAPAGETRFYEGASLIWLGDAYAARRSLPRALEEYNAAVALFSGAGEETLDNDSRCELATALTRAGEAMARLNRRAEATAAFERALTIARPHSAVDRGDIASLYVIAAAYDGMGERAKSADIARHIPERSRITPLGFLAVSPPTF